MTYRFLKPDIRVALDRDLRLRRNLLDSLRPAQEREAAIGGGSFPHS